MTKPLDGILEAHRRNEDDMQTQYPNIYYRLRNRGALAGTYARYQVQFYSFYPDIGPKGTPGRGPYCVNQQDIRAADMVKSRAEIAARGIRPLPSNA